MICMRFLIMSMFNEKEANVNGEKYSHIKRGESLR